MDDGSKRIIVITCTNLNSSQALRREFKLNQRKGKLPEDAVLLVIHDPKSGIGSGSSTLNALLVATEYLSAKAGYAVLETQVLQNIRIFIYHIGHYFFMSSSGIATLPCINKNGSHKLTSNMDILFYNVFNILAVDAPPGVWVCSTDMLLAIPPDTVIDWTESRGVRIFGIPSDIEIAKNHGVLQIGKDNEVVDIFYLAMAAEMEKCKLEDDSVAIAPVLVFMCTETVKKFVSLVAFSPMDSCTYLGLDQGAEVCKLSFVCDFLLSMTKNVSEHDFVYGNRSMSFGRKKVRYGSLMENYENTHQNLNQNTVFVMKQIRSILWKELRGTPLKTTLLHGGIFSFLTSFGDSYRKQMLDFPLRKVDFDNKFPYSYQNKVHNYIESECKVDNSCIIINSILENGIEVEKNCVVTHCYLTKKLLIKQGCIINGISQNDVNNFEDHLEVPEDTLLLAFNLKTTTNSDEETKSRILVTLGVYDQVKLPISDSRSTFCNKSWNEFFARTGIRSSELWGADVAEEHQSLFHAKLFPYFSLFGQHSSFISDILWIHSCDSNSNAVKNWRSSWKLSLSDILKLVDVSEDFDWQRKLYFEVDKRNMYETLIEGKNNCLIPFIKNCVAENYSNELLSELDKAACKMKSADRVARALSCIADVLGEMAGVKVGLRSGPAGNETWMTAYKFLETGNIVQGVNELANRRKKWLDRPDLLIRAARHYEGAMQILVRHAVETACKFVHFIPNPNGQPDIGTWVIAEAPARVDLSGGWSDTPPITYEHGGAVTNFAIKIGKKKPIGSKVRKIPEYQVQLIICGSGNSTKIICNKLSDLKNYSQPNAPGALLKAAICCADIIELTSKKSLQQQLKEKYGCGFEVQTWSNLPQGSGLGGSSILSGTLLAALLSVTGQSYDTDSLIHSVLHLEQLLTTGGGWQDQVGGLLPAFKLGTSQSQLPLKVHSKILDISDENMKKILDHSLLVFTGKPRLAKNMLQGVVRNWHSRKPEVVQIADWIVKNAHDCAEACIQGDLCKIGECLNNSWAQKKIVAPGCEPPDIKQMIDILKPHLHGFLLTGAAGGGFLFAITKQPLMNDKVDELLSKLEGRRTEKVYSVEVDREGLTVHHEQV